MRNGGGLKWESINVCAPFLISADRTLPADFDDDFDDEDLK